MSASCRFTLGSDVHTTDQPPPWVVMSQCTVSGDVPFGAPRGSTWYGPLAASASCDRISAQLRATHTPVDEEQNPGAAQSASDAQP